MVISEQELERLQNVIHQYTTFFVIFDIVFFITIILVIIFVYLYLMLLIKIKKMIIKMKKKKVNSKFLILIIF